MFCLLKIRDYEVDVDILGELEKYDWTKTTVRGEKFLACSPFRLERHPSFAVRLDNGVWIDSGAEDQEWKKGNFVRLLSWLRNETYNETADYLLEYYGPYMLTDTDTLRLNLGLKMETDTGPPMDIDVLDRYRYRHKYLTDRGIGERTQTAFRIGYDPDKKAATFPLLDRYGQLANIKFRSITDKTFWYYPGGQPIWGHVYGLFMLHRVHDRERARRVYIVESEIDALTLWEAGFPAVALGGANMTGKQRDLLLQSPAEEYVIATDNDKAGRKIAESIRRELNGYRTLFEMQLPLSAKDVNDLSQEQLIKATEKVWGPICFSLRCNNIVT